MEDMITKISEFVKDNWAAIVVFFDKLWAFLKETVLKDDSIFATKATAADDAANA